MVGSSCCSSSFPKSKVYLLKFAYESISWDFFNINNWYGIFVDSLIQAIFMTALIGNDLIIIV